MARWLVREAYCCTSRAAWPEHGAQKSLSHFTGPYTGYTCNAMPRPILATIHPSAIAHNLAQVRARVAPFARGNAPRIWAVVKADAYGHGIQQAFPGLQMADGLAMLDLDEAVRCREAGWTRPILMLEGFFDSSDLPHFTEHRLQPVVHHADQLTMLETLRAPAGLDIHLKLNGGMNRLGFTPREYRAAHARALELQRRGIVASIGHVMHFAHGEQAERVQQVMEVFNSATQGLPGQRSVCNSAATLGSPQLAATTDWLRPGICLYGATPFEEGPSAASLGLLPAMSLQSRIIAEQRLEPGAAVGYGGLFVASEPMRVGIVACGYADGYPRHAPSGTPVVVAGVRTRLVGRVSMDMLAVDLNPVPQAGVGAPVTLWGADGLSVDEVAGAAGTIGYELLTAVARRVPRRVNAAAGD